jgi:hypothetical protein
MFKILAKLQAGLKKYPPIKVGRPTLTRRQRAPVAANLGGRPWRRGIAVVVVPAISFWSQFALADEGSVSSWLPGTYGSLAAVPA